MGYSLELYNVSWRELRTVLGSSDSALFDAVKSRQGPKLFLEGASPSRNEWAEALSDLLLGPTGRFAATWSPDGDAGSAVEASRALALAFVAVIRETGEFIGSLQHSSASGQTFREGFLG